MILFCGLPGSGKTTLAKKLEAEGRGIRLCTDDWRADMGIPHSEGQIHKKLQRRLYLLALDLIDRGQDVVLEDGLWTKHERTEKRFDAQQHGARVELHFFDLSFEELWRRLDARNKALPYGAEHIGYEELKKFWQIYERPDYRELSSFDKVFVYQDNCVLDSLASYS
jgi:predicted kinase